MSDTPREEVSDGPLEAIAEERRLRKQAEADLASTADALARLDAELTEVRCAKDEEIARLHSDARVEAYLRARETDITRLKSDLAPLTYTREADIAIALKTRAFRKLPKERTGKTHHFCIGGYDGYLTVNLFPEGDVGEVFVRMAKVGSTLGGLMAAWSLSTSMALRAGVPLEKLCGKFIGTEFEPAGATTSSDIPLAKSIPDYVFRFLCRHYLTPDAQARVAEKLTKGKVTTPVLDV